MKQIKSWKKNKNASMITNRWVLDEISVQLKAPVVFLQSVQLFKRMSRHTDWSLSISISIYFSYSYNSIFLHFTHMLFSSQLQ